MLAGVSATDRDWSVPAGELDWDCTFTLVHIVSDLYAYAGQVASGRTDYYVPIDIHAEDDPTPEQMLHAVRAGGRLLAAIVATAPDTARAWHTYGDSDPDGFAGMGMIEVMVHMHDLAAGLGVTYTPDDEICARVLARMFPDAPRGFAPWPTLLWATGRISLGEHPRRGQWRWRGEPSGGDGRVPGSSPARSLDGLTFAPSARPEHGEVDASTRFAYHERDGAIWAEYSGGDIVRGYLVGTRAHDTLDFRYVQVNRAGGTSSGHCASAIVTLADGRLRLDETWEWESRPGSGTSTVEQVGSGSPLVEP